MNDTFDCNLMLKNADSLFMLNTREGVARRMLLFRMLLDVNAWQDFTAYVNFLSVLLLNQQECTVRRTEFSLARIPYSYSKYSMGAERPGSSYSRAGCMLPGVSVLEPASILSLNSTQSKSPSSRQRV